MDISRRPIMALAATALAVALGACGGGTASGPSGPSSPSTGAATAEATTLAEAPASQAPSTGGSAGGVCDLVTADELATAFAVSSVSTSVIIGPPDACIVQSDAGDTLASWSKTTSDAGTLYDAVVTPGQSSEVSGIADRAAFVDNMGFLILKGDELVVVVIASGADLDEAASQEVSRQLGALIAGRM